MSTLKGRPHDPQRAAKAAAWGLFIKRARAASAKKLGKRLRQADFAAQLGVPVATLQQWEIGRRCPYQFYMTMILEKLKSMELSLDRPMLDETKVA